MKAYQADIAKLEGNDTVVLGVSIDSTAANAKFAQDAGLSMSLLSDTTKEVTKQYGVLNPLLRFANRTTFVVDQGGVIRHVDAGGGAVDPTGAVQVCSRLKHTSE
jgi:thioredoxin-dependent peroxiredoxin